MVTDTPVSALVEVRPSLPVPLVPGVIVSGANSGVRRVARGVRRLIVGSLASVGPVQSASASRLTQPPVTGVAGSAAEETTRGRVSFTSGELIARFAVQLSWVFCWFGVQ